MVEISTSTNQETWNSKQETRTGNGGGEEARARCCNCFRKFTKDCLPTRQFYYEFYEEGVQVKKHVLIQDAIIEIYQWRLFGASDKVVQEAFRSLGMRVCGSVCGIAIAKLYGAIKVFDSLAHVQSELHLLTKTALERLVNSGTDEQLLIGEPIDTAKLPPNLLHGKSRIKPVSKCKRNGSKQENGIGSHIFNRPLTQHFMKLRKGHSVGCGGEEGGGFNRILTLDEYPVQDPLGATNVQRQGQGQSLLNPLMVPEELVDKDSREVGDYTEYSGDYSGGEYGDENGSSDLESEDQEPLSPKSTIIKPFLCQLCGAGLNSRQGLRTHLLLTHKIGSKENMFVCEHCGKEFFFDYLLKNHLARHATTRDFPCTACNLKFTGSKRLYQHMRDVHATQERRFVCNLCPNKSFKHQRTLWDHTNSHHGNKGKRVLFSCKFGCGSTSSRNRSLLAHYRRCLKRPMEDNQQAADLAAVESIGGIPDGGEGGGVKGKGIYACLWDCGRMFTSKSYRGKHSKGICRLRPNRKPPNPKSRPPQTERPSRKRRGVTIGNPTSSSLQTENELEAETAIGEGVGGGGDRREEPIEVETVFDTILGIQ